MQLKLYNTQAKEVGVLSLSDAVFACELNEPLIHQVVVAQQNNERQGTKSTLTRTEVRGGGIKPWRQKGTGRARQGSIRAPQWIKGGVVFAPKPRDFSQKINKKVKAAAFRSAISYKAQNGELLALDALTLSEAKTKQVAEILKNFQITKRALIVLDKHDEAVLRAGANIQKLCIRTAALASVTDIVRAEVILATGDALKQIEQACECVCTANGEKVEKTEKAAKPVKAAAPKTEAPKAAAPKATAAPKAKTEPKKAPAAEVKPAAQAKSKAAKKPAAKTEE